MLEESFAKVCDKNEHVLTILNEYKIDNENLEQKLANKELTSVARLRQYKQMELEFQQLRAEMDLLGLSTQIWS